jgi:hypothetical protein
MEKRTRRDNTMEKRRRYFVLNISVNVFRCFIRVCSRDLHLISLSAINTKKCNFKQE